MMGMKIVLSGTDEVLPGSDEIDMVILDEENYSCRLFEIKHTENQDPHQYRHLVNEDMCRRIEFKYGAIHEKIVLYRGHDTVIDGIKYLNVERYLEQLGNN